jgi:tetratricopeptide (TPR) repeat protein
VEKMKDSTDLTKISGIGKKTAKILQDGGITSLSILATTDSATIKEIFIIAEYQAQIKTGRIDTWIEEAADYLEETPAAKAPDYTPDDSYLETPLYQEILIHYQNAEWDVCIEKLEALTRKYPGEQKIQDFLEEARLHSTLHADDIVAISEERKEARRSKRRNMILSIVIFVGLIGITMSVIPIIEDFTEAARVEQEKLNQERFLAQEYKNAENLLQAGRPLEALEKLEEIQKANPDYVGLDDLLLEVQRQTELNDLYNTAASLREEDDLEGALDILLQIEEVDPYFKDIEQQISFLETETSYQNWVTSADQAFEDRNWQDAIDGYEAALAIEVSTPYTYLEDNLYDSYLNQIMIMLQDKDLDLEGIETAENYYKNSLSLKPQDQESLEKREALKKAVTDLLVDRLILSAQLLITEGGASDKNFAAAEAKFNDALDLDSESAKAIEQQDLFSRYKSALENFNQGLYILAAPSLEYVYQKEPNYAGGAISYLLYEIYFATGKDWLIKGRYTEALGEFQRSEIVALKNPEIGLPIFQSREMVAFTLGKLGAYEDAAYHYSNLVENSNILTLAEESSPDLYDSLLIATGEMAESKFREAFLSYQKSFETISSIFTFESTVAASGDSIPNLAFQLNSTIQGIIEANNLPNLLIIANDGVYLIPYINQSE